ncbi:MAG: hypothetical protein NTY83_01520 [Candidatus Micrarchaeota archaeon]|nr:hypothetical protein [Candidatus Micrarchaeota archaeon]
MAETSRFLPVIAEAIRMAGPLQRNRAEEILKLIPVRINDYDMAVPVRVSSPAERPPVERLPEDIQFEEQRESRGRGTRPPVERLPEDIEPVRQERGRPSVERLPEELPEAPREERGTGRRPDVERLPEDLPAQKAVPQQKTNLDWDIIQGETERKEKPRRRGGGKEFNPTVD